MVCGLRAALAFGIPALTFGEDWREKIVPSFEHMHAAENAGEAPGAESFKKVTEALQQLQANNGINESLLESLPFLPKTETLNVTMSDGVNINTIVVNPWPYDKKKPACLVRSPYGSGASQNLALIFLVLNGHAAVMQEGRGTWDSGGEYDIWRHEASDGTDTINWITSQDWSDGEVYSMGGSADGIESLLLALADPPELHGQWIIWATPNGHHFVYPGGAYREDLMFGYMGSLSGTTHGTSMTKVIPDTEEHEAFDPYWYNLTACGNQSDISQAPGCHYQNIKWPMILSAGWWDIFHSQELDGWNGIRTLSDPTVRDQHVLIVGPLGHCIAGTAGVEPLVQGRFMVAEADGLVVGLSFQASSGGGVSAPTSGR